MMTCRSDCNTCGNMMELSGVVYVVDVTDSCTSVAHTTYDTQQYVIEQNPSNDIPPRDRVTHVTHTH